MNQILVVEDEPVIRSALRKLLEHNNYRVSEAGSVEAALEQMDNITLVISDLRLPGAPGTDLIKAAAPIPVLIMTSYASLRSAVDAMKMGAVDYIAKPFNHDEMILTVDRILKEQQQSRRTRALSADLERSYPTTDIVGESHAMRTLLGQVKKLSQSNTNLLLTGESGSGKELIARTLHQTGPRSQAPMISFSCTASAADTQEAELFGYDKGAFDGKETSRRGLAEDAHGGTLFIDEIGGLTKESQVRLLHLIDKQENSRIGSIEGHPVDVRLIASSQTSLKDKVQSGEFREDLYYRIKGAELVLPPLRNRGDDVVLLANSLLSRISERLSSGDHHFTKKAVSAMKRYRWPGNVRELGNAIERAVILAESSAITPELLGIDYKDIQQQTLQDSTQEELSLKEYFSRFVLENQDDMTETELARKLGISRKCLWERRQRYGLARKKA